MKQKDVDHVMGWPKPMALRYLLERGYKGDLEVSDSFVNELHDQFVEKMISFYKNSNQVVEIEGTSDVFFEIKTWRQSGFRHRIRHIINDNLTILPLTKGDLGTKGL